MLKSLEKNKQQKVKIYDLENFRETSLPEILV